MKLEKTEARENREAQNRNINQLRAHIKRVEEDNSGLVRERDHWRAKYEEASTQLKATTKDLKDAEEFLSNADKFPTSKVVHIVERLNAKIFNTAADIVDLVELSYDPPLQTLDGKTKENMANFLSGWLGTPLSSFLYSRKECVESSIIQAALQAGISVFMVWLSSSWDCGASERVSGVLQEIYARMRVNGTCTWSLCFQH